MLERPRRLDRDTRSFELDRHEEREDREQMGWTTICAGPLRIVAARAKGESVPMIAATVKRTMSRTGSDIASKDSARLEPNCAYGSPVSAAAEAKATECQQEPAAGNVARVGQGERVRRQHRDKHRYRQVTHEGKYRG